MKHLERLFWGVALLGTICMFIIIIYMMIVETFFLTVITLGIGSSYLIGLLLDKTYKLP